MDSTNADGWGDAPTEEPCMSKLKRQPDWDPRSPDVQAHQTAAYDAMRQRCPVAFSD